MLRDLLRLTLGQPSGMQAAGIPMMVKGAAHSHLREAHLPSQRRRWPPPGASVERSLLQQTMFPTLECCEVRAHSGWC